MRTFTIDYAQIAWVILAVVLAATGAVNPWLVLLLATMDAHIQVTYEKRQR